MALKFDLPFNGDAFSKTADTIKESVKSMVSYVDSLGGDVDKIFEEIAKGGDAFEALQKQTNTVTNIFNKLIDSMSLTRSQSDIFKSKFRDSLTEIANSSDKAEDKIAMVKQVLTELISEAKLKSLNGVGSDDSTKKRDNKTK